MANHKILVLGSTGGSGRAIVAEALARGHAVTAFARNPDKASDFGSAVAVKIGDVQDAAAVEAAVAGHDTVISTLGIRRGTPVCAVGVGNAIAAMKKHGARRLIALSAYGTGDSRHGFYGWMLNTVAKGITLDKIEMERQMAASGLDWTSVRPPILTTGPRTGNFRVLPPTTALRGFKRISRADVAAYMIDIIDDRKTFGAMPIVARDEQR